MRNAVEAIELGIPMPPIYVSEQQNGDYLVLESKDTIYSLLQFLKNKFFLLLRYKNGFAIVKLIITIKV